MRVKDNMSPSSDDNCYQQNTSASVFTCDSCGKGNFTCITFVKPAGERGSGCGLGFDVCREDAQHVHPARDVGFYVRDMIAGGLADRDGRLKEGMRAFLHRYTHALLADCYKYCS